MLKLFWGSSFLAFSLIVGLAQVWPGAYVALVPVGLLFALGVHDLLQTKKAVLRNFPVLGHFRYLLELIRPEIQQYFIEGNTDGMPVPRVFRSLVYQRAKGQLQTVPFGTQKNVYETGYEWVNHSLRPAPIENHDPRVKVGGPQCKHPYNASLMNISAMSYGSLSKNAILALNMGARAGNFAHNTGEGGLSPHHLAGGGDLIWQIGTAYFSCRNKDGTFNPELFAEKAKHPNVKMIELKLSQGAKPGHGGILPAAKVTAEIAAIRGVEMGKDVASPGGHSAFTTPLEMLHFIQKLRDLSDGKPVGFKLCVGRPHEFLAICKAMVQTNILPDFITVDGGEGGTGAAPLEFTDSVGTPLEEGLSFVHNALIGFGLRDKMRLIASGRIFTAMSIVTRMAQGADMVNSARGMLLAIGCIHALRCNTNHCPVGITTNNPDLVRGLVVEDKYKRVHKFHHETMHALAEMVSAMGYVHPHHVRAHDVMRRVNAQHVASLAELFPTLEKNSLREGRASGKWAIWLEQANPLSFSPSHPTPRAA